MIINYFNNNNDDDDDNMMTIYDILSPALEGVFGIEVFYLTIDTILVYQSNSLTVAKS